MIAQMWQDETAEVREQYAKQAAAEKAEHALKYPGKSASRVNSSSGASLLTLFTTRLHLPTQIVGTPKGHQIQAGNVLSERQEQSTSCAAAADHCRGAVRP